ALFATAREGRGIAVSARARDQDRDAAPHRVRRSRRQRCLRCAAARPDAGGGTMTTASDRIRQSVVGKDGKLAPLRVMAASGQLGYGIPDPAFNAGLERKPHLIGADMGSIDPGPYYLGAGKMAQSET